MVDHDNFGKGMFAGYVRVSSANPDADVQRSIAAQKHELAEFARENGSGTVVWYVDEGNGIALPALQALLADARSPDRDFDTVLVSKPSRLSRDIVEFHAIKAELQRCGVTVVSVTESDVARSTERLVEGIVQTMDDYYRVLRSEDTRRGIAAARCRRQGG